jgi:hypothetical protein
MDAPDFGCCYCYSLIPCRSMLDSNDGLKYVGLLCMVAIRQGLALMPTQKSKCEESLEFVNWSP